MLYLAAGLICALALAHSYLGERYILIRLFRRGDLPKVLGSADFTKGTLRFVWHLTSVFGVGMAIVLAEVAAHLPVPVLVATIGGTAIVAGLLPLFFTRARHLSWPVLFAVGGLCLYWTGG
jgi:hypothetical protein